WLCWAVLLLGRYAARMALFVAVRAGHPLSACSLRRAGRALRSRIGASYGLAQRARLVDPRSYAARAERVPARPPDASSQGHPRRSAHAAPVEAPGTVPSARLELRGEAGRARAPH